MNTNIDYNKLKIGDRLIRTKGGVFSKHHAIYAGFWENQHLIAENQNGFGVRYITLNKFLDDGKISDIKYNNFNENSQIEIINRVNNKIKNNTKYHLTKYNCEHFVNEVLTGVAESKQIQIGVAVSIGILVGLFAFRKK